MQKYDDYDDPILRSLRSSHTNNVSKPDPEDDPILQSLRSIHRVKPANSNNEDTHNHDFKSGVRVSSIRTVDFAEIERRERAAKKLSQIIVFAVAGTILIFGILYISLKDRKTNSQIAKSGNLAKGTAAAPNAPAQQKTGKSDKQPPAAPDNTAAANSAPSEDQQRAQINNSQRQRANALVDSAKSTKNNASGMIAFYRMAISFNRYNLQAWQGLLQAYRESNKPREAATTEKEMTEIFGNEVQSVNTLVGQFGELTDTYKSENGAYRVEYKTSKRSKNEIQREVFNIARSVRSACNCQTISIHAVTGTGKGMIAHTTGQTSIHTFSDFKRGAEFLWLD